MSAPTLADVADALDREVTADRLPFVAVRLADGRDLVVTDVDPAPGARFVVGLYAPGARAAGDPGSHQHAATVDDVLALLAAYGGADDPASAEEHARAAGYRFGLASTDDEAPLLGKWANSPTVTAVAAAARAAAPATGDDDTIRDAWEAGAAAGWAARPHRCTPECWEYMIRYGCPTECDPFAARAAADDADEFAALRHADDA